MTANLVIGSQHSSEIQELIDGFRNITPRPSAPEAVSTVSTIGVKSAELLLSLDFPDGKLVFGEPLPARHFLAGVLSVLREDLSLTTQARDAVFLHNRLGTDSKWWASFEEKLLDLQARVYGLTGLNSLNLDTTSHNLDAVKSDFMNLERFLNPNILYIADIAPWYPGSEFWDTESSQNLGRFGEFKDLEIRALTDCIRCGSNLVWPFMIAGLVFWVFDTLATAARTGEMNSDWNCRAGIEDPVPGLEPSRLTMILHIMRIQNCHVPKQYHFPTYSELTKAGLSFPSLTTTKILDLLRKEGLVFSTKCKNQGHRHPPWDVYGLTPWGRKVVPEVFSELANSYDEFSPFCRELELAIARLLTRDYRSNRNYALTLMRDAIQRSLN